jgi:hypothetical protein
MLLVAISAASAVQVHAGWNEFVHRSLLDWHRNNAWPQPFVHVDRLSSCAPFVTMAQNGLCSEFTLGEYHFHPETQILTEAGRRKVIDILRRQPEGFSKVFVVRGADDQNSSIRLDSVQQAIAATQPHGAMPEVRFTDFQPRGLPASYIDAVGRKLDATVPDPRLPEFSSTSN